MSFLRGLDAWLTTEPDPFAYDEREIDWDDDWDEDGCAPVNGEPESLSEDLQVDPKVA